MCGDALRKPLREPRELVRRDLPNELCDTMSDKSLIDRSSDSRVVVLPLDSTELNDDARADN